VSMFVCFGVGEAKVKVVSFVVAEEIVGFINKVAINDNIV